MEELTLTYGGGPRTRCLPSSWADEMLATVVIARGSDPDDEPPRTSRVAG